MEGVSLTGIAREEDVFALHDAVQHLGLWPERIDIFSALIYFNIHLLGCCTSPFTLPDHQCPQRGSALEGSPTEY